MKTLKLSTTILLFGLNLTLQAQEAANASGGEATGVGGTVSYSVGQVVYTTHTGTNGSVAQGVQHAYEIIPLSINENTRNIALTVFPNPTANNLNLQIIDYKNEQFSYQLFDMQGKFISNGQLLAEQTSIDMSALPNATYFIHVVDPKNQKIKSFKVIKTN